MKPSPSPSGSALAPPALPSNSQCAPGDLSDMLIRESTAAHRVAMSSLQTLEEWSEDLRNQPSTMIDSNLNRVEFMSRLGGNINRLMTTLQRTALTLERLRQAEAERAATAQAGKGEPGA